MLSQKLKPSSWVGQVLFTWITSLWTTVLRNRFNELTSVPCTSFRRSSGGETSLKMKNSKLMSLKMLLRENTVTNVMKSSEQVGIQVNTWRKTLTKNNLDQMNLLLFLSSTLKCSLFQCFWHSLWEAFAVIMTLQWVETS